jgi:hypothetical protein
MISPTIVLVVSPSLNIDGRKAYTVRWEGRRQLRREALDNAPKKWSPSIGPSSTNGAVTPSWRSPHMKVVVFQWPCGTLSTSRLPCGALP